MDTKIYFQLMGVFEVNSKDRKFHYINCLVGNNLNQQDLCRIYINQEQYDLLQENIDSYLYQDITKYIIMSYNFSSHTPIARLSL